MPHIHLIVAMTRSHVIGHAGRIPWSLPDDLHLFRQLTLGQTVIGGRRTFDEIGHPLDGRLNLVLSRTAESVAGLTPCRSLEEALSRAESAGQQIFCIGGSDLYHQMLPLASWLHISWIEQEYTGDTLFPTFSLADWRQVDCTAYPGFLHCTYQRQTSQD